MTKSLVATTQTAAAASLSVNRRTFIDWLAEGCPGEQGNYVISEMVLWARENKWGGENSDDALLGSIDDEDLRARLIKERIEELQRKNKLADFKIAERNDSLIDVEVVEQFLMNDFAVRIRSAIETVEKKHGPGACSPIRKALERLESDLDGGTIDLSSSAADN